jgi:hypothetical protein
MLRSADGFVTKRRSGNGGGESPLSEKNHFTSTEETLSVILKKWSDVAEQRELESFVSIRFAQRIENISSLCRCQCFEKSVNPIKKY